MTQWEVELNRRLDDIATDAEDWDEIVDQLADVTKPDDIFYDYTGLLAERVKRMRRRMNRVTFHNGEVRHYRIWNYSYEMYSYFRRHYPEQFVETAFFLAVPLDVLTPTDRARFQEKVEPL